MEFDSWQTDFSLLQLWDPHSHLNDEYSDLIYPGERRPELGAHYSPHLFMKLRMRVVLPSLLSRVFTTPRGLKDFTFTREEWKTPQDTEHSVVMTLSSGS
jgi:hypothetical protein